MKIIIFIIIAYFFGAIPNGIWIGKHFKHIDIREYGSKNSGATNAYRVLGPKYGLMVLLADVLKGYLPLYIASRYGIIGNWLLVLGFIAIIGHMLSIFIGLKGGKGVATTLGVLLFLIPKVTLILFIVFAVVVAVTKYISLGSIISAFLLPMLVSVFDIPNGVTKIPLLIVSIFISIFVIYKHKTNIERIKYGTENKFKF